MPKIRSRTMALICTLTVCAAVGAVHAEQPTIELPAGTVVRIPDKPPITLNERRFLLTEAGIDEANTALVNERRLQKSLQACADDLDTMQHAHQDNSWWTAAKWGTYGAVVVGAFALGAAL